MTANDLCGSDGEPVTWLAAVGEGKGYHAAWIDSYLLKLAITPVIPAMENEERDARGVVFDPELCRKRNIVECLTGWLKEFRRVFSRYERSPQITSPE